MKKNGFLYVDESGEGKYYVTRTGKDRYTAHCLQETGGGKWLHWEKVVKVTKDMLEAAIKLYGPGNAAALAAMLDLQHWPPEAVAITEEEKQSLLDVIFADNVWLMGLTERELGAPGHQETDREPDAPRHPQRGGTKTAGKKKNRAKTEGRKRKSITPE